MAHIVYSIDTYVGWYESPSTVKNEQSDTKSGFCQNKEQMEIVSPA